MRSWFRNGFPVFGFRIAMAGMMTGCGWIVDLGPRSISILVVENGLLACVRSPPRNVCAWSSSERVKDDVRVKSAPAPAPCGCGCAGGLGLYACSTSTTSRMTSPCSRSDEPIPLESLLGRPRPRTRSTPLRTDRIGLSGGGGGIRGSWLALVWNDRAIFEYPPPETSPAIMLLLSSAILNETSGAGAAPDPRRDIDPRAIVSPAPGPPPLAAAVNADRIGDPGGDPTGENITGGLGRGWFDE